MQENGLSTDLECFFLFFFTSDEISGLDLKEELIDSP